MEKSNVRVGLVVDANYTGLGDRNKKYTAIDKIMEAEGVQLWKDRTISKYIAEGQTRTSFKETVLLAQAGIYDPIIIVKSSPTYTDQMKHGSIDSDKLEDRSAAKSLKERIDAEGHYSEFAEKPEKFGKIDQMLHWFADNVGRDVTVYHVDTSVEHPEREITNVTKEYFALAHRDMVYDEDGEVIPELSLSELQQTWATTLGLSGWDRDGIVWLMDNFSENDLYVWANGGLLPGTSPDKQIVKCPDPECGKPVHAAPASVGFKSFTGDYVPVALDPKQMTCPHCGASLAPCFSGNNTFLPISESAMLVPTGEKDLDGDDLFDTIAAERTEFDDNIDPLRIRVRAEVMEMLRINFELMKDKHPVKKNNVPIHKVNNVSVLPETEYDIARRHFNACPANINMDVIRDNVRMLKGRTRRIKPLTLQEEANILMVERARRKMPAENRKNAITANSGASASIEEIREKNTPKAYKKNGVMTDYAKKALARRKENAK